MKEKIGVVLLTAAILLTQGSIYYQSQSIRHMRQSIDTISTDLYDAKREIRQLEERGSVAENAATLSELRDAYEYGRQKAFRDQARAFREADKQDKLLGVKP